MRIYVCVKQVPDTSGKVAVNPDGTLNRASMQTIINPDDMNAVEAALQLKEETGCKVIAVTMGPPPAEGMLRELMAMGVDEGVLVTAREFGGSDTFATSQIIAAGINAIGLEEDDIVFCGRQAIDGDTAQVGPQIAEKLGLPQISYVADLKVEDGVVTCKRLLEDMKSPSDIVTVSESPKTFSKLNDWKASVLQSILLFLSFLSGRDHSFFILVVIVVVGLVEMLKTFKSSYFT